MPLRAADRQPGYVEITPGAVGHPFRRVSATLSGTLSTPGIIGSIEAPTGGTRAPKARPLNLQGAAPMATEWHPCDRVARHDFAMEHDERLVDVHELAAYLEVPVKTLYAWRYRREGPPAFRVGRHLRYRWRDVQLWIQERIEPEPPGSVSASRRSVGGRG